MRKVILAALAALILAFIPSSASAAAACCTPPPPIEPQVSGWRFAGGNVCVQDQTVKLADGVWRGTLAWSKAPDINLIWRRSCAGFTQAQTITVQEYRSYSDWYYGRCLVAKVWTTGGYLQPGRVTRAAVFINTECNVRTVDDRTAAASHVLGVPVGLTDQASGDFTTVMGCAGRVLDRDYRLVEQIYPW